MASTVPFPAAVPAFSLWAQRAPIAPPSGAVVATVLQFGDVWETRPDGSTLIRLSPERAAREDIALLLGDEQPRALDVSLIWDEEECQLLQVLDAAPLRPQAEGPTGNAYADARMRGFPRHRPAAEVARAA
jgi:hypothetical protein